MDLHQTVVALATIVVDQRRRLNALAAAVAPVAATASAPVTDPGALEARLAQTDANIQAVVDQARSVADAVALLVSQRGADAEVMAAQLAEVANRLSALEQQDVVQRALALSEPVSAELEAAVAEAAVRG